MKIMLYLRKLISLLLTAVMFLGVGSNRTEAHTVRDEAECRLCFTVLSDVHIEGNQPGTYNDFGRILKDVKNNSFGNDALIFLGDNTMNGQELESQLFYGEVCRVQPADVILSAAGNHDLGNGNGDLDRLTKRFLDYNNGFFGAGIEQLYYYKVIGGCYFIFLTSESRENGIHFMTVSEEQLAFLNGVLDQAAAEGAYAFVFAHHPIYDTGMEPGDDAVAKALAGREKVLYFAGHTHSSPSKYWSFNTSRGVKSVNLPKATDRYDQGSGCGVQVEVYPEKVLVRFRSFYDGVWIDGYEKEYP